jgi:hypothetical protein
MGHLPSRYHQELDVRRLAPEGLEAWKQVIERGYEGYVAKDGATPRHHRPARAEGEVNSFRRIEVVPRCPRAPGRWRLRCTA